MLSLSSLATTAFSVAPHLRPAAAHLRPAAVAARRRLLSAPVSQAFDGAAAEAYVTIFESLQPSWDKHVELIAKSKNSEAACILDIGSGPGEPSCTLAAALPKATITCTDAAEDMNSKAKARAEKKGVALSAFAVCPGEDLSQFADASFDFVTMNFALMFVPERERCLRECARVLRPGGKVLSTVWKTNSFMAAIGKAMATFTGEPPSTPPPVNPMALKADGAQEELAKGAGFVVEHSEVWNIDIAVRDEAILRACSLIVVGPKLAAMEAEGKPGATAAFQDLFVEVAPTVEGVSTDEAGGVTGLGGLCQMIVMTKA